MNEPTAIMAVFGLITLILVLYYAFVPRLSRGKIEVTRVQLSDDGSLVDISYLVKKPGRGLDRRARVYLLDELRAKSIKASGEQKLGKLIDINSRLNHKGSIQVSNKYKMIKKGSLVTVGIGEYQRRNLIVI